MKNGTKGVRANKRQEIEDKILTMHGVVIILSLISSLLSHLFQESRSVSNLTRIL